MHYGLLRPHEVARYSAAGRLPRSRRFLAVPFVGKDAPSHASEYAHPDIAIGLATLAYRYEGLRPADFGAAIHQLRAELDSEVGPALKRPASLQWIRWVQAVGKRVRGTATAPRRASEGGADAAASAPAGSPAKPAGAGGGGGGGGGGAAEGGGAAAIMASAAACSAAVSAAAIMTATSSADALADSDVGLYDILPLHLLDLMDVEYMTLLYKLLQRSPHVVRFYLAERVFPDTTAHQSAKLSANGQDLGGSMLFSRRIAFSGTPSSLLPLEMGECVYQQGDDATMLRTLTEPNVVSQLDLPAAWSPLLLLKTLTELSPPADALIDAGALVTGMSNRQVAVHLLPLPPEP